MSFFIYCNMNRQNIEIKISTKWIWLWLYTKIIRSILTISNDQDNQPCFYFFFQIEMSRLYTIIILACCILGAIAQKPARIGPDGKPLLNRPDLELCKKSKYLLIMKSYYNCVHLALSSWVTLMFLRLLFSFK